MVKKMVNWKNITSDKMYNFISKYGVSLKHDITIDNIVKRHTKKQLIDELKEFGLVVPARHIINMYSRKKISKIDDASKRMIAFASYNLALYIKSHQKKR